VIEAILLYIGVLKKENRNEDLIINVTKLEILDKLGIDIDKLLQNEELVNILIHRYKFNNDNLEKFAELIFDFIETTNSINEKKKLIVCISKIYVYLDENRHPISYNRFYILEELKNIHKYPYK
jgi:hypothetical protein